MSACTFHDGVTEIPGPIVFDQNIEGESMYGTEVRAASDFSGSCMVDFNHSGFGRYIRNISLNTNGKNIKALGSTSSGGCGGNPNTRIDSVRLNSQSTSVYAMGGSSTVSEAGMMTGMVANVLEIDAPLKLQIGNCQDDVTMTCSRFQCVSGEPAGSIELLGSNIKLTNTYLALQNGTAADAGHITIGPNQVDIDGLFVEGASNLAWLFHLPFDEARLWVKRLQFNLSYTGGSANAAIFHTAIGASNVTKQINIDGVRLATGSAAAWAHIGNFRWATSDNGYPAWVTIGGLEEFSSPQFFTACSAGYANLYKLLRVQGFHNGDAWCKTCASDMVFS